jgi:hypothetical protein
MRLPAARACQAGRTVTHFLSGPRRKRTRTDRLRPLGCVGPLEILLLQIQYKNEQSPYLLFSTSPVRNDDLTNL